MAELTKGEKVTLTNGEFVTIDKELGRGGQGIVYLVTQNGEKKALKWYLNAPEDKFYRNLERNIIQGAPSGAFLWPEFLTQKQKGSYGYVMKLRPQNYFEFGNFLLAKKSFKSFSVMLAAAMKICDGFGKLHLRGCSYQDLNDGNFFINPINGDVLICDNDNVVPYGEKSGIMGKARYMAPEIVAGGAPDSKSDRFSLSVILFMLFYANHPFEGAKVVACPCMTEKFEKEFYGSKAVFIYDPMDKSNLPVRGIHQNVIRRWPVFPAKLREVFIEEFSQDKLKNCGNRMVESVWKKIIVGIRDTLVRCPHCGEETFLDDNCQCMECGKTIDDSRRLTIGGRSVILTKGTSIYIDDDNIPDCEVVAHPQDKAKLLLKNLTPYTWTAETPNGKLKQVDPNGFMPINPGIKIDFTPTHKGEIALKQ